MMQQWQLMTKSRPERDAHRTKVIIRNQTRHHRHSGTVRVTEHSISTDRKKKKRSTGTGRTPPNTAPSHLHTLHCRLLRNKRITGTQSAKQWVTGQQWRTLMMEGWLRCENERRCTEEMPRVDQMSGVGWSWSTDLQRDWVGSKH